MANKIGEKELSKKWPHETGIEADSKHEGRKISLKPKEESLVLSRKFKLLDR